MACQRCGSDRVLDVNAKCSDLFDATSHNSEFSGYVPAELGIGKGDYVRFSYCLACGQIQGKFPIPEAVVEENEEWVHCTEDT